MKFAASYSCGKDSALALYRAIQSGHTPIAIVVSYNKNANRSWFHGVDSQLLNAIAASLNLKLILCESEPKNYNDKFEEALKKAKAYGAEACIFGDIDIENHRHWDEDRCQQAGLSCHLPLWQQNREDLTQEFIQLGFTALVKCIDKEKLPATVLGKPLTIQLIDEFRQYGIDVCGENGEYHTLVVDGPLFSKPIAYQIGKIIEFPHQKAIDLSISSTALHK